MIALLLLGLPTIAATAQNELADRRAGATQFLPRTGLDSTVSGKSAAAKAPVLEASRFKPAPYVQVMKERPLQRVPEPISAPVPDETASQAKSSEAVRGTVLASAAGVIGTSDGPDYSFDDITQGSLADRARVTQVLAPMYLDKTALGKSAAAKAPALEAARFKPAPYVQVMKQRPLQKVPEPEPVIAEPAAQEQKNTDADAVRGTLPLLASASGVTGTNDGYSIEDTQTSSLADRARVTQILAPMYFDKTVLGKSAGVKAPTLKSENFKSVPMNLQAAMPGPPLHRFEEPIFTGPLPRGVVFPESVASAAPQEDAPRLDVVKSDEEMASQAAEGNWVKTQDGGFMLNA
jgi:hypothetical protein